MAVIHVNVSNPFVARPQSSIPSKTKFAHNYAEIGADDGGLTDKHTIPTKRHRPLGAARWIRRTYEVLQEAEWLHQTFWKDTWNDMKVFPWGWLGCRFFSHMLPSLIVISLATLIVFMSAYPDNFTYDSDSMCTPDGTFMLSLDSYTPWTRTAVFAINTSFGSYSFGIAKLIDVCWDVGLGRGVQASLAIISYTVFTKALSRTMESSSVSYDTFKAITLQSGTVASTATLVKDFFKPCNKRVRAVMVWTILASLFTVLVPTWLSAMTGYTVDIQPYIEETIGDLVPIENFSPVIYIIHDGARLGGNYSNDTMVTVPWPSYGPQLDITSSYGCGQRPLYVDLSNIDEQENIYFESWTDPQCKLLWAVSKYVHYYGLSRTSTALNTTFCRPNSSSVTTLMTLSPPLNISAYLVGDTGFYNNGVYNDTYWWNAPSAGGLMPWQTSHNGSSTFNPRFVGSNSSVLYSLEEFNSAGRCLQQGPVLYKWGFSFLLLYSFVIAFVVWIIGMWTLYLDSWFHSRLGASQRQMGFERAFLDISRSMPSKVNINDLEMYGNPKLQPLFSENQLTYSGLPLDPLVTTRWTQCRWWWREFSFKEWVKNEKRWLYAMLGFNIIWVLSFTTSLGNYWLNVLGMFPGFGVFLVLAVGRKVRSRWLLFAFFLMIFFASNCWWIQNASYEE